MYSRVDAKRQAVPTEQNAWPHLVAGGTGGLATAIVTAPLDVFRTRLQSSLHQTLRSSQKMQSWRGLYAGLGPSIVGVAPASAIKFYTYGNCKRIYAEWFQVEDNAPSIHFAAATTAGIATSTATNPIWVIKTRMQLDHPSSLTPTSTLTPRYRDSFHCMLQIFEQEGCRGFYRGLSASFLGVAESALHLVLYERFKNVSLNANTLPNFSCSGQTYDVKPWDCILSWLGIGGSAGIAKLIAGVMAYPHEVVRTRLRQAPLAGGKPKYTSLGQCIQTIYREEGYRAFYGGITPHMMRAVPSTAITLGVYEAVLKLLQ